MDIHVDQQDRSTAILGQPMTPDIFLSQTQLLAVEFLERCVRDLEPLSAVTGSAGTGKTVALNSLLTQRERVGDRIFRVNNFVAGPMSLARVLGSSLGIADAGELSAEALELALRNALVAAGRSDPPVLAVDDAQSLLPETLRYLCLLAGLREAGRPLLRILLVGRPGFTIRQSMPRQFTLETMAPDDARQLVLHRFKLAGVAAPDTAVQEVVQNAQGNLRKLDLLLGPSIETARTEGRRRLPSRGLPGTPRARRNGQSARRSTGPWLVLPALLVVGAAGAAIAYHDGMLGSGHDATPAAVIPVPRPANVPAAPAAAVPAASPQVSAPAVVAPPIVTAPAVTPPVSHTAPVALPPSPPAASQASLPVPVPAPAATEPLPPPPMRTATVEPSQAAPSPPPAPSPPAVPPTSNPAAAHFRVYNISACHQGVCPRWSVTDLDQRQHFVAAFNPAPLHLDRDTLQRVREGSLDLVVSGSVARSGSEGPTLYADALQQVAPHHGRAHASPSASDPIELAPPQILSPQPGFLPVPPSAQ